MPTVRVRRVTNAELLAVRSVTIKALDPRLVIAPADPDSQCDHAECNAQVN